MNELYPSFFLFIQSCWTHFFSLRRTVCIVQYTQQQRAFKGAVQQRDISGCKQGWAKLVLIALERYSVELKRLTFNLR
jgi:hypothetical protein